MLSILQRIEPGMMKLKITRKDAPGLYPELLKDIKNHTRSSDYMIQFMKKPLTSISNVCSCKARELGLFQYLPMPIEAHQDVPSKLSPLPIPKPTPITPGGVLVYISMGDSMRLPFIDEHRPSKNKGTNQRKFWEIDHFDSLIFES